MADFYDVHRKWLHAADGKLRVGEPYRIAVREPIRAVSDTPREYNEDVIQVVTFVATRGGKLKPASPADHDCIRNWTCRHRATPMDWFEMPEFPYADSNGVLQMNGDEKC